MTHIHDIDDSPQVMGDDGQFHATDEAVDFSDTPFEAWIALVFFVALGFTVFYQFFTRYALNDSAAWTEEIARYLLIATVFTGAAVSVAKNNHIQVDFLYRLLPTAVCRAMAMLVDAIRVLFFGGAIVLTWQMMSKLGNYQMTIIDLPMNIVYGVVWVGFIAMFLRSLWVARVHLRRGYTVLERPESEMSDA
jgi:TRAP-type C4-dicarboxylate transport system permease small subunit